MWWWCTARTWVFVAVGKWGARTRARTDREVREFDFEDCTVELAAIHMFEGTVGGDGVCIFESGLSSVLAGCPRGELRERRKRTTNIFQRGERLS